MSDSDKKHEKGIVRRSVSMPADFEERIVSLATEEDRSFSSQIVRLARKGLEQQEAASA